MCPVLEASLVRRVRFSGATLITIRTVIVLTSPDVRKRDDESVEALSGCTRQGSDFAETARGFPAGH